MTVPALDVDSFMASLEHPCLQELQAVRRTILSADPRIAEGIKWNAPSFRTSEYFATFHLRAKPGVQVILHFGARKRLPVKARDEIADPKGLLEWLADDRASARFADLHDVQAKASAFEDVIRQWIEYV